MSSENYVSSDGFKPLVLPLTGEELIVGRQYALTPLVRLILADRYGVKGVPTIVECTRSRVGATTVKTITTNEETGKVTEHVVRHEAQGAAFRVYVGNNRSIKFELDLSKLEELAPFYDKSHKLPELEEEWFKVTSQQSNTKFRGQLTRWWSRGDSGASPVARRISSGVRSSPKFDLSILNLA